MQKDWGAGPLRITCNPRRAEPGANGRTVNRKNPYPYRIELTELDASYELTPAEARDLAIWLQAFLIRTGPQVQ